MNSKDSQIIDALGGTSAVARLCQVEPPSVSEWRRKGIPRARRMFLELAHPEVFPRKEKGDLDAPGEQAA